MPTTIRKSEYFHATVDDQPGEAYRILELLAEQGVNLLAFSAVPVGPTRTQITLFPEDPVLLGTVAGRAGMVLDGPHGALLVRGSDRVGALINVHRPLAEALVNVYATSGVSDGRGGYGYIVYVRPGDLGRACAVLGI